MAYYSILITNKRTKMNQNTFKTRPRTARSSSWLRTLVVTSFLFTLLPAVCLAQESTSNSGASVTANARAPDTSSSATIRPSSTSSAPPQTHTVQVGLADHKFVPDVTEAKIGDTVEFRFYPTNHSVVRAEYNFPCIPYEMTGNNKQGFFSGFNAVSKVLDDAPRYSIKINDTNPIYFYCSAPGSCITYGMVGAINPNSSTPISTQQTKAKDSAYMLNPGEPFPAESPLPPNLPSSTSVPIAVAPQKHSALSPGAIAGIVIAALSVVALAAGLFFFMGRSKSLKDEVNQKSTHLGGGLQSPAPGQVCSPTPQMQQQGYFDAKYTPQLQPQPYVLSPPGHPAYSMPQTPSTYSEPQELPLNTTTQKFGAYGLQEQRLSSAPPYGWHVNAAPAEMEGTPGREEIKWEEVSNRGSGAGRRMF
ncbi:hypothetical protein HBH98_067020 [Parastagonospora nodorum]|nr:hypothetical protein HBH50_101260 [Parastagonospora nodorum]KAH4090008.1 hypothetical protein HBH48_105040 [Parastagonospora nodorum]KAH4201985.1 hypothetical protein HBH42_011770 [Parastagonospora nodorum]KAH4349405.1 hypothetical protein HBH98_067020 [Parastagonospora nodorum]KAH4379694.1 hypothetical protein HBH97_100780 [Parastagonospora nodorum]